MPVLPPPTVEVRVVVVPEHISVVPDTLAVKGGYTVTVNVTGSPVSVPLVVWYFGVTENVTTCVVLVVLVSVAVRLAEVVPV